MYLSGEDATVYAFCNLPVEQMEYEDDGTPVTVEGVKSKLLDETNTTTLQDLREIALTIETEDGANASSGFVMSGSAPLKENGDFQETYTIEVARLAAKLQFKVYFMPDEETDEFAITGMFMYNIPKGSYLLGHGYGQVADDEQELNAGEDYTAAGYFNDDDTKAGYRIDYEPQTDDGRKEYNYTTFYQFENRRGAVYDDYDSNSGTGGENWTGSRNWTLDDGTTTWNDLSSLRGVTGGTDDKHYEGKDLFMMYRQINKRMLAHYFDRTNQGYTDTHIGFPGASYLVIEGVYQRVNAVGKYEASKVRYYVYLGKDNYADFNVKRNHNYIYDIKIYTEDKYDTRVYSEAQGNLAIYYDNAILDAHFNVLQTLLYSQTNWTARVVDPDETPWLEISTSPSYKPRKAGDTNPKSDVAQFSLSGGGGLNYIYVHTDEFIPKIENPQQNPWYATTPGLGLGDRVHMGVKTRKGKIVIESATAEPVYINVEQYAAQMVICHINYDIHTMKEVLDTFYIEQVMEKKNMSWGFDNYWSYTTDDLIAAGQWDGLANTRRLYDVALNGDGDKGVTPAPPAYEDGIPSDIALGYALGKNRDRNGNGKIDYDEIVWYLPAANEVQAIYGHTRPLAPNNDKDFYMNHRNARSVYLPYEFGGPFHTSSPSAGDPNGITSGFTYFVNMYNGEKSIGERSRYYNVICARRHNAWKGDNDGEVNGDMDVDDEWGDGNEVVVPR